MADWEYKDNAVKRLTDELDRAFNAGVQRGFARAKKRVWARKRNCKNHTVITRKKKQS